MSLSLSGFRIPRTALALALAAFGALLLTSSAKAACNYPEASQVFSQWNDNAYYQLAPDGGLEEGGSGWTFSGGAGLIEGNESYYLNGGDDDTALDLPYGGVATSPKVCVDDTTPQFRLMVLNGGKKDTRLKVSVIYEMPNNKNELKGFDVRAWGDWQPSDAVKLETKNHEERVARISFTPKEKEGDWLIDDLYIDPFARR
jgi:hypothetical protein